MICLNVVHIVLHMRSEERRVGKEIKPVRKIHIVNEEALGGGPKGGVEKKN